MKVKLVCVGSIKEPFYKEAIFEYTKRLQKYCKLEIIEVKQGHSDTEIAKQEEFEPILEHLEGFVVITAIEGKSISSQEFANKIKDIGVQGNSTITFVIGGSFGVDDRLKERANMLLSFSKLTFPHQLFRVLLLEQIYRAFTIMNNTSYHK